MIPAHDSPVAAMGFNSAGTKLSTASEKASFHIEIQFSAIRGMLIILLTCRYSMTYLGSVPVFKELHLPKCQANSLENKCSVNREVYK